MKITCLLFVAEIAGSLFTLLAQLSVILYSHYLSINYLLFHNVLHLLTCCTEDH